MLRGRCCYMGWGSHDARAEDEDKARNKILTKWSRLQRKSSLLVLVVSFALSIRVGTSLEVVISSGASVHRCQRICKFSISLSSSSIAFETASRRPGADFASWCLNWKLKPCKLDQVWFFILNYINLFTKHANGQLNMKHFNSTLSSSYEILSILEEWSLTV